MAVAVLKAGLMIMVMPGIYPRWVLIPFGYLKLPANQAAVYFIC
jgi:hypothetical protein